MQIETRHRPSPERDFPAYTGAATPPAPRIGQGIGAALADHRPFLAVAGAFVVASVVVGSWAGWRGLIALGAYYRASVEASLALTALAALLVLFHLRLRAEREAGVPQRTSEAWAAAWRALRREYATPERITGLVLVAVVTPLVFATFSGWKVTIGTHRPFAWDVRLMRLDRALHGGRDPWTLLQPWLGVPWVTRAVGAIYFDGWLAAKGVALALAAWTRPSRIRMQFLVTYVLLWVVLGCALAIAFASAGPCYFGRVTDLPDPYAGLMAYLHSVHAATPVSTLARQEELWHMYQTRIYGIGAGISALPSLHVAVSTVFALAAWRVSRPLGVMISAFAVVILLGSVALGWHYAVDGYASVLVAIGLWWAVGRVLARLDTRAASRSAADIAATTPRPAV